MLGHGTARSAASADRSLIMTSGVTWPPARWRAGERGTAAHGRCAGTRRAHVGVRRGPARQGLVDRLVRDPHRLIIGEAGPEPVRDLLRAPRRGPAPVGPAPVPPPGPPHLRTRHGFAVWPGDRAGPAGPARRPSARRSRRAWRPCAAWPAGQRATGPSGRYSTEPPRVAAFRRSSREIVDGDRAVRRAISWAPHPPARRSRSPSARRTTGPVKRNRFIAARRCRQGRQPRSRGEGQGAWPGSRATSPTSRPARTRHGHRGLRDRQSYHRLFEIETGKPQCCHSRGSSALSPVPSCSVVMMAA